MQRTDGVAPSAARHKQQFVPPFAYEAYIRGELALAQGDARSAALQLEMATAAPDEDAYLLSRLADAQAQSGDRVLAQRTLLDAERLDACQEQIWLTRGAWAEQDGDLSAAEQAYARALACDARSEPALLAMTGVLVKAGHSERAMTLLARASSHDGSAGAKAAFAHALTSADPAEARFALDTWLSLGAPDRALLTRAIDLALLRGRPSLALSLSELSLPGLSLATRARLALSALDVTTARALLAQHQEAELGGARTAAQLARLAGDIERAELYAGLALQHEPDFALRALHVRALAQLGEASAALEQTKQVSDASQRRELVLEQLTRMGLGSLADELRSAGSREENVRERERAAQ